MVVSFALLVFASGCAGERGDSGERAEDAQARDGQAQAVARELATAVKEADGGTLISVTCESRPTELENSTQWECRSIWHEGTTTVPTVYTVQVRSDGQFNGFAVKDPR
jgi:hypothetical protein